MATLPQGWVATPGSRREAPVSGPHRKHIVGSALHNVQHPLLFTIANICAQCKCKTRTILCRALTLADPRPRSRRPLFFPSAPSSSFSSLPFSSPFFFSTSIYSTYILAVRGFVGLVEVSPSVNLLSMMGFSVIKMYLYSDQF